MARLAKSDSLDEGCISAKNHLSIWNLNLPMSLQYIEKAKLCIFRICQKSMIDEFGKAVKTLWKLDLLFDSHGILRIGGRLNRTDLYMEMKHPVVLPGKHSLVRLLGVFYHKKFLHQGYRVILANMKNDGIVLIGGRYS
uniref:uncharacterized protein LOC120328646 n=1 Tax=Styela clava TaxID=7725 RepID=UPI00193A3805|nr:uncharacterized protein LOC120328646 [Styela clava]